MSEVQPLRGILQVDNFIAVASGKGGVGKTTVAVNLALALQQQGFRVGLLDADIYGPSIPTMLDLQYRMESTPEMMRPVEKFGVKVMSIGFLIEETQAVIWRGPLVSRTIRSFLDRVSWGKLDYLVVDLPPGTGDPSITIAQLLPKASIVMVTTPQKVALADVKRAISMFRKMDREVVGIIENMSYFCCDHSAERIELFGAGGGEQLSSETGAPLLGAVPLDMALGRGGDSGVPLQAEQPDAPTSRIFSGIARRIVAAEAGSGRSESASA
jgi:ATP-binding protein involved in chromosome partitioning